MSDFPRLTPPEAGNLYYNKKHDDKYSAGLDGYNPCILGNYPYNCKKEDRTGYPGLTVLSNCTGFVTGCFNEEGGYEKCKYLGDFMAYYMITAAKKQGLEIGEKPKLGAVMCWGGGNGHVAIVAHVIDENTVYTSESGWNSEKLMWNQIRKKGNGRWGQSSHTFQGFIYNPDIVFGTCPYTQPLTPITKGAKGDSARWMQWHLNWYNYGLAVDGSFGPASLEALKDFQSKNGIPVTGYLDELTRAKLIVSLPWNRR